MSDTNHVRVAFFDEDGVATHDVLGSKRQVWANAGLAGFNVRILTGTQWQACELSALPNISEIPENPDA